MERLMARATGRLQGSLSGQSAKSMARGMQFPVGWDPYFTDFMTLLDIYHYPTQHYNHHRRQLTLAKVRDV
jgi:hypothetical protein